ncbi:MAG: Sec-independent protein translocase subunit TatA [Actinomycetota bacterium]
MFRGLFEGWHLVVLLLAVLVIFGSRRLPDAARSLGRSMRILKSEVKAMGEDESPRDQDRAQPPAPPRGIEAAPPASPVPNRPASREAERDER